MRGPREGATEEDYYLTEYSSEEIGLGMAALSLKFAAESRSQRGSMKGERLKIIYNSMKRVSSKSKIKKKNNNQQNNYHTFVGHPQSAKL